MTDIGPSTFLSLEDIVRTQGYLAEERGEVENLKNLPTQDRNLNIEASPNTRLTRLTTQT
jgi:hypothetical protein